MYVVTARYSSGRTGTYSVLYMSYPQTLDKPEDVLQKINTPAYFSDDDQKRFIVLAPKSNSTEGLEIFRRFKYSHFDDEKSRTMKQQRHEIKTKSQMLSTFGTIVSTLASIHWRV